MNFDIKPSNAHNLQRPEMAESPFLMWWVTNNPIYRGWGWEIFKAFEKHTNVDDGEGYTSLDDGTKVLPTCRDEMKSFWLVSGQVICIERVVCLTSFSRSRH